MSKVDRQNGDFIKRRHATKHIGGADAVAKLNTIVDEANKQIAHIEAQRAAWQQTAEALQSDNDSLKDALRRVTQARQLGDAKGIAREALLQ